MTPPSPWQLETTKLDMLAELTLYGAIGMSIGSSELECYQPKPALVHWVFMNRVIIALMIA